MTQDDQKGKGTEEDAEGQEAMNWQETARQFSQNADYWRRRAERAEMNLPKEILCILDGIIAYLGIHWESDEARVEVQALRDRLEDVKARLGESPPEPIAQPAQKVAE